MPALSLNEERRAAGLRGMTWPHSARRGKTHSSTDKPHKQAGSADEDEGSAPLPRSSCQDALGASGAEQMNMDQRVKYIFKMLEMSVTAKL